MTSSPGMKFDGGKPRMELLSFEAIEQLAWILTYGAEKYLPKNWQKIENLRERYLGSCLRHISKHLQGEVLDKDPLVEGVAIPHLGCAFSCLMFVLWDMVDKGDLPRAYDFRGVREAYERQRAEYRAKVQLDAAGNATAASGTKDA